MQRVDEGLAGLVESFSDDAVDQRIALGRHHRPQPGEARAAAGEVAARQEGRQDIGAHDRLQPVLAVADAPCLDEKLMAPPVHRRAMPPIDLQQQAVLALEVIGDAAGIGASGLRDVADGNRVEAAGGEQRLRRCKDRLAQIALARRRPALFWFAVHGIYTLVQNSPCRQ
jgi:hypothetical protein